MNASPPPGLPPGVIVKTCLVLGGARSGKSDHAQALAESSGLDPIYLATATVWDDEMRARVEGHRATRDGRWRTVEEPLALAETLARVSDPHHAVLVDCLTLWLTNLMLGGHDVGAATARLLACLPLLQGPVVLVSNEVGSGIVPDNALARAFRDAQGRLNRQVAAACEGVVLIAAGLPLVLKPESGLRLHLALAGTGAEGGL